MLIHRLSQTLNICPFDSIESLSSYIVISIIKSVDSCGKEEVLNDWHYLQLTQVGEEFVILLYACAVQNEVSAEDEDASGKDRQDVKAFKSKNSVKEKEQLVDFESADEGEEKPWECGLERLDAKSIHMVADLRLIHLE